MVLCVAIGAQTGDPGPFEIDFHDAGVPVWLDRDKVLSGLKSKKIWLGITSRDKPRGAQVTRVFKDFPAEQYGVRVGDIITNDNWGTLFKNTKPNEV